MSEIQDPQPPKKQKEKAAFIPGQPLPRLWKTEPDPEEESEESVDAAGRKQSKSKDVDAAASPAPKKSKKAASRPAKAKPKKSEGPDGEKRVLLEETPAFDTIEARQRARLAMSGLLIFCMLIFGWVVYGMIFGDSSELVVDAVEMPAQPAVMPGPPPSREPEAHYMLEQARTHAKAGRKAQAVAMLERVVSVYRGTQAAAEARAALERPGQNLPLFPDRPYVLVQETAVAGTSKAPAAPPGPGGAPAPGSPAPGPGQLPIAVALPSPPPAGVGSMPPTSPGPARPAMAAPSLNPATVGAPTTTTPPNPPIAQNAVPPAPPSAAPGVGAPATTPAVAPASGPGPGPVAMAPSPAPPQSHPQPPPGPGDAANLVPPDPANSPAAPATGGEAGPGGDRGTPAPRARIARALPPGFKARPEAGLHESGWPLAIVGERDDAIMVLVPAGTFMMGRDGDDPRTGPAHPVRLSTYYIDQHEVTNRQFRTFLSETHYRGHPPGRWLTDERQRSQPDDAPAVYVSYQDAEEYAIWAHKRLPTEAQWEMAARSLDGRQFPWGDEPIRWSRPRKFQQIDPVGSFPEDVSPYGAFDMAGNAVEWVRDWFDPHYFDRMKDKTTEDPTGPPSKKQGIQRTVKGSSKDWLMYARQGMDSDRRAPFLGFRCALAVEGGEASAIIAPHPPKPAAPQPGTPPPGGQAPGGDVPF